MTDSLSEGWRRTHLGKVATVDTGGTPSRSRLEYWNGDIAWMASGEVNQRRVRWTKESITSVGLAASNAKIFQPGAIMVALNGQGRTRGTVARLDIAAACNQSLAAVKAHGTVDQDFLYHVLDSRYDELRLLTGRGRAGLNLGLLHSLPLLLPPLPEQHAIAAVLDSIDEAIERTEAVIAATEELHKALLQNLLTRGVPGWHTEWKHVPGIGTIPACWDVVRLRDMAWINRSSRDPKPGVTISYFDISSIAATGKLAKPQEIAGDEAPSRARRVGMAGDILVSTVRPYLRAFAKIESAPENLVVSTGFAVVTPRDLDDGAFLYQHVLSERFVKHLEPRMTGSGYPAVRPEDVGDYPLPLPSREERVVIGNALDAVLRAAHCLEDELDRMRMAKAHLADVLLGPSAD